MWMSAAARQIAGHAPARAGGWALGLRVWESGESGSGRAQGVRAEDAR